MNVSQCHHSIIHMQSSQKKGSFPQYLELPGAHNKKKPKEFKNCILVRILDGKTLGLVGFGC